MKALDNYVWDCLQIIYMQSKKLDIYMQKQEIRYLHAETRN